MATEIWRLLEPNVDVIEEGDYEISLSRISEDLIGATVNVSEALARRVTIPDAGSSLYTINRWLKDGMTIRAVDPNAVQITDGSICGVHVEPYKPDAVPAENRDTEKWHNQAEAWVSVYNEVIMLCGSQPFRDGEGGLAMVLRLIREMHADATKWRDHKCEPSPIPGMPEGWEVDPEREPGVGWQGGNWLNIPLRRITPPAPEPEPIRPSILLPNGETIYPTGTEWLTAFALKGCQWAIDLIEQIEKETPPAPVCVFPRGVFPDGWVFETDGIGWFSRVEPVTTCGRIAVPPGAWSIDWLDDRIHWRPDLQPHEKIVRVGPEAEGGV